jgi:predicted phage terminase large subunit-like protein
MQHLDTETIAGLSEKGRKSFFFFARAILGFNKLTRDIHRPLCKILENSKNTRVKVVVPRCWYKSTICSVAYPLWRAINNPNIRIVVVQNSFSNACKKLAEIKQIVEKNELFRTCYPEILPDSTCRWGKECLEVKRTATHPEGTFEAAGVGTAVISRHYDIIVEDDTVSPDKDNISSTLMQPTRAEIEKAIGWHKLTTPLLIEPAESQVIVVGTRWAEDDLLEYIDKNSPEYIYYERAARETDGKPDPKGAIVWERFDNQTLAMIERELGPYMFAALYMNSPTSAANAVFKRDWIQYYTHIPENLITCTSVDVASADKENATEPDYTVIMTTGVNPANGLVYILYYDRARMNPGETIDRIFYHYRTFRPVKVKIEAIAYQRTLGYWLQQRQNKQGENFFVELIKGLRGSKEERIRGLQPFFANRRIFMKVEMDDLERELLAFPKGVHDDLPDTLTLQMEFWNDALRMYDEEQNSKQIADPFSGSFIINELQERAIKTTRCPNDMGLYRLNLNNVRDYKRN